MVGFEQLYFVHVAWGAVDIALESAAVAADSGAASIVIMNGGRPASSPDSFDGSTADAQLVTLDGNYGYGAAANLGISIVARTADTSAIVCVLNDDVELTPPLISRIREHHAPGHRSFLVHALDDSAPVGIRPTIRGAALLAVSGVRMALRIDPSLRVPQGAIISAPLQSWIDVGGFDPAYMLYLEDTDLYERCVRAEIGVNLIAHPPETTEQGAAHAGASSTGQVADAAAAEYGVSLVCFAKRHARLGLRGLTVVSYSAGLLASSLRQVVARNRRSARFLARAAMSAVVYLLSRRRFGPELPNAVPVADRRQLAVLLTQAK